MESPSAKINRLCSLAAKTKLRPISGAAKSSVNSKLSVALADVICAHIEGVVRGGEMDCGTVTRLAHKLADKAARTMNDGVQPTPYNADHLLWEVCEFVGTNRVGGVSLVRRSDGVRSHWLLPLPLEDREGQYVQSRGDLQGDFERACMFA